MTCKCDGFTLLHMGCQCPKRRYFCPTIKSEYYNDIKYIVFPDYLIYKYNGSVNKWLDIEKVRGKK